MTNVTVNKLEPNRPASTSLWRDLEDTFETVRTKAFELFERRGGTPGKEVEDWTQAERELFWVPPAELAETETEFTIRAEVPGFAPKEVQVTAQPDEILIRGTAKKQAEKKEGGVRYTEFGEKTLYRRFKLAAPVDLNHVTANVENGLLTVKAPKVASQKAAKAAA